MTPQRRQLAVLVAVLVAAVIVVALVLVLPGDGDSSPKASPTTTSATSAQPTPTPTPSPTVKAELVSSMDVKVSGDFGKKPKLTVPDDDPSKKLLLQIVSEGDGPAVVAGQTTVLDYLGQTWKPKKGKANVFDNSFDRKTPSVFVAGSPDLIAGWNAAVVGLKVGSRALVSIPPKFGYGAKKEEGKELSGETLLFVIDIHAAYAPDATADGAEVAPTVEGLPEVESKSGQKPKITSIEGASADGDKPKSGLLIEGTGEKIDPARKLVFQVVEHCRARRRSPGTPGPRAVPRSWTPARSADGQGPDRAAGRQLRRRRGDAAEPGGHRHDPDEPRPVPSPCRRHHRPGLILTHQDRHGHAAAVRCPVSGPPPVSFRAASP